MISTDFEIITSIHCNVDWEYRIHTHVHSVGRKLVYVLHVQIHILRVYINTNASSTETLHEWLSCTRVVVSGIIGYFVFSGVSVVCIIETKRAVLYYRDVLNPEVDLCTALCG